MELNTIKIFENLFNFFILIILGAVFGSFINACVYRFKHSISILGQRSICENCKYQIKSYDLIPIISFLILKGKCRNCKKDISIDHLVVELFSAIIFPVFIILSNQTNFVILTILTILYITFMIVIVSDFRFFEIPDQTHPILILFSFLYIIYFDINIFYSLLSAVFASGLFFIIFKITGEEKIGFGDVKLVFSIGLILGFYNFSILLILASLSGIIYGVLKTTLQKKNLRTELIPFGSFLSSFVLFFIILFLNNYLEKSIELYF